MIIDLLTVTTFSLNAGFWATCDLAHCLILSRHIMVLPPLLLNIFSHTQCSVCVWGEGVCVCVCVCVHVCSQDCMLRHFVYIRLFDIFSSSNSMMEHSMQIRHTQSSWNADGTTSNISGFFVWCLVYCGSAFEVIMWLYTLYNTPTHCTIRCAGGKPPLDLRTLFLTNSKLLMVHSLVQLTQTSSGGHFSHSARALISLVQVYVHVVVLKALCVCVCVLCVCVWWCVCVCVCVHVQVGGFMWPWLLTYLQLLFCVNWTGHTSNSDFASEVHY